MIKKRVISVIVIFILSMAIGFLVHATLLAPRYAQLPNLFGTSPLTL
jgi:hypothetical protein